MLQNYEIIYQSQSYNYYKTSVIASRRYDMGASKMFLDIGRNIQYGDGVLMVIDKLKRKYRPWRRKRRKKRDGIKTQIVRRITVRKFAKLNDPTKSGGRGGTPSGGEHKR